MTGERDGKDGTARRSREELQERLAHLELVREASGDGMWDWNVVDGEVFFDDRWFEMVGYRPGELPHQFETWERLLHPEDLPGAQQVVAAFLENTAPGFEMEFRMRTKEGGWHWILSRSRAVSVRKDGTPARIIGIHTDIQSRKEAEQRVQETMRISRDIMKTIPTGLFIYQYTEPETLRLIDANPAALTMTSKVLEEVRGQSFDEIWTEARSAGITERYLEVARSGELLEEEEVAYEDSTVAGAFSTRVFTLPGDRLCVAFENITEQKRVEHSLRTTQETNDKAPFPICWISLDGRLIYSNEAMRRFTGYGEQELTDRDIGEIDGRLGEVGRGRIFGELEVGECVVYESIYLAADGETAPVEVTLNHISYGGQRFICAYVRDLTDEKKKEEQIQRQLELITELSTPVMEIWSDILLLPIVGVVDNDRTADMTTSLQQAIMATAARCAIIDVTGVEVVDTRTADALLKVSRTARLMGTRCVIAGLRPAVAQTLVSIGADLSEITTHRNLKSALRDCISYIRSGAFME